MLERKGKKNAMTRGRLQGRTLYREFNEEVFPNDPLPQGAYGDISYLTTLSPHYRDMRTVLYNGTSEQAAKQYLVSVYALAGEIMRQGTNRNGNSIKTYDEALKDAVSRLETEITKMNPNPISFFEEISGKKEAKSGEWIKWLMKDEDRGKKYIKDLAVWESMFSTKINAIKDLVPKYIHDPDVKKAVLKSLRRAGFSNK